jgi:peptidoglycan/LPS O-acetylase OafA/YrhL
MSSPAKAQNRLIELDALRGVGALCVLIFHYSTRFHEIFPAAAHVPFTFPGGNYRVLLFFTISGFSIFFTLDRIGSVGDFVVNRIARLYPAYLTAMLLTLSIEYSAHVWSLMVGPATILANMTMLQGFAFLPAVDGAYWTLTVEIAFYVCMVGLWKFTAMRRLEPLLLGWLALRWLYIVWPDMPERIVMLLVLRYVPFFIIGILCHRIWSGQRSWRQQAPYCAAVLLTVAATEAPDIAIIACLLFATFVAMMQGRLRAFAVRPLTWLGGISYSFYLIHQHIGFVIMLKASAAGFGPWTAFFMAFLVALTLGALINRLVERPAATVILNWWKRRRATVPIALARA